MKKIIISAIMGLMAVCGMAQETPNTVVITKVGGETIKVAIEDVQDLRLLTRHLQSRKVLSTSACQSSGQHVT